MATVDVKLRFARQFVTDPKGKAFDDSGIRRWIRDFWLAIDGYKAWAVDTKTLCPLCRSKVGELYEFPWELADTRSAAHGQSAGQECRGLDLRKVHYVVFDAPRRGGKTFNCGAYVAPTMFLERWEHIKYFATGEDHSKELDRDNFRGVVVRNKKLLRRAVIREWGYEVPRRHNKFSVVASVTRRAIGGAAHKYFVDECREVDGGVVMAALPQILDIGGVKCTNCSHREPGADRKGDCPQCAQGKLIPYYGTAILMSSAGKIDDGHPERCWFPELSEQLEKAPDPNWHLIKVADALDINPDVQVEAKESAVRVLGKIPSLSAHVGIEYGNKPQRIGDKVFHEDEIRAIQDPGLHNRAAPRRLSIAYLDASRISDITSLVIVEDESEEDQLPFAFWSVAYIEMLDPKGRDPKGRILFPKGISEEAVRPMIHRVLPNYADRLLGFWIDVRNVKRVPWAMRYYKEIRKDRAHPLRRLVRPFEGGGVERDEGWSELERYIRGKLCRIPVHDRLFRELVNAEWKMHRGNFQIRETNAHKLHLELAESLAAICYLITQYGTTRRAVKRRTVEALLPTHPRRRN